MILNFFLYARKSGENKTDLTAVNVILRLSEWIPWDQSFKLGFDDWFYTLRLFLDIKSLNILTIAATRPTRFADRL